MEPAKLIAAVESGARIVSRSSRDDLHAAVANCDGWVVEDLVRHLGRVYRSVATIVSTRSQVVVPPQDTPAGPHGDDAVAWFDESVDLVLDALRGVEPSETLWTWAGVLPATFYFRRMAYETAVHAHDASAGWAEPFQLDSDLAADGVDEYLERVLPFTLQRWTRPLPAGSLHLHRTDGDGEWLVEVEEGAMKLRREHAKGDAALRGSGQALFLAMWNRMDVDELECFGDPDVARAWTTLAP